MALSFLVAPVAQPSLIPSPPPPGNPWPPVSPPGFGFAGSLQLFALMPTEEARFPDNCTEEEGEWFEYAMEGYIRDPTCDDPTADCSQECRRVGYTEDDCKAEGDAFAFVVHSEIGSCGDCVNATQALNATRGYRCDDGMILPCPVGKYCYTDIDAGVMVEANCSDGYICLTGFDEPLPCSALKTCINGEVAFLLLHYLFALFVICVMNLLALRLWCRKRRMLRKSDLMRTAFVDEGRKLGQGLVGTAPVQCEFKDVCMVLKASKASVLKDINGSFPAGSLVALMGPSGGGKTTFMNAMLDRAPYGFVSGTFTINGVEGGFERTPSQVGFVPQDDVVHADLTVYENLFYNAMLRLPKKVPKSKKVEHVIHVMRVLGIEHIRNNLVGDATKRGVSGGQKKRVNIGVELAAMPAIIFMDEPTSGLDGAATIELARCLGQLRLSGLTIICVIHQPRLAVYEEFTHLLLLGRGGQQVYCGRGDRIEEYFNSLGFRLPPKENPADWLIDVVCGLAPRYREDGSEDTDFKAPKDLFDWWAAEQKDKVFDKDFYYSSGFEPPEMLQGVPLKPITSRETLGRWRQTYYMCGRSFRQHEMGSLAFTCLILFCQAGVFAFMSAQGEGYDYPFLAKYLNGYNAATPLYYLFCASFTRPLFTKERLNYNREFKSGISSIGYFFAKNLYNLIMLPFLACSFSVGLYIFAPPLQWYGSYFAAAFFCSWFWSGAAIFISITIASELAGTLILIFWPLFEPIYEGSDLLNSTARDAPLSFFACSRWNMQALFAAEISSLPTQVVNMTVKPETKTLEEQLEDRLMQPKGDWNYEGPLYEEVDWLTDDFSIALFYLFLYGLVFRGIGLFFMVVGKYSQGGGFLTQLIYVVKRIAFVWLGAKDKAAKGDADAREAEFDEMGWGMGSAWDTDASNLMLGWNMSMIGGKPPSSNPDGGRPSRRGSTGKKGGLELSPIMDDGQFGAPKV